MKKIALVAMAVLLGITNPVAAAPREVLPSVVDVQNPIHMPLRGQAKIATGGAKNMTYHNGPIMSGTVNVVPIFWGPKWADATFKADKITGMDAFYKGYNNSNYAKLSSEYTDSQRRTVTTAITVGTAVVDSASTASSATNAVFAEVVAKIGNALDANSYYPVYTDLPRGNAGYCAWHSYGTTTVGGATKIIKFAFFFDLTNDSGCSVAATTTATAPTASIGNVSAHELAEMLTDPQLNAWYDQQGAENADKCAWQFKGSTVFTVNTVQYTWNLQGEWSNKLSGCGFSTT